MHTQRKLALKAPAAHVCTVPPRQMSVAPQDTHSAPTDDAAGSMRSPSSHTQSSTSSTPGGAEELAGHASCLSPKQKLSRWHTLQVSPSR